MPVRKIKTFNDPILKKKARTLTEIEIHSPTIKQLIKDIILTMSEETGIGLAAPQIGESVRIIVIKTNRGPLVILNPKINRHSWKKVIMEEGCLSFPEYYGLVKRPATVVVGGRHRDGQLLTLKAEGILARVLQHEIDHLDGKIFIDKIIKLTKGDAAELKRKMQS